MGLSLAGSHPFAGQKRWPSAHCLVISEPAPPSFACPPNWPASRTEPGASQGSEQLCCRRKEFPPLAAWEGALGHQPCLQSPHCLRSAQGGVPAFFPHPHCSLCQPSCQKLSEAAGSGRARRQANIFLPDHTSWSLPADRAGPVKLGSCTETQNAAVIAFCFPILLPLHWLAKNQKPC